MSTPAQLSSKEALPNTNNSQKSLITQSDSKYQAEKNLKKSSKSDDLLQKTKPTKEDLSSNEKNPHTRLKVIDNSLKSGFILYKIWLVLMIIILFGLFGPSMINIKVDGPPQLLIYISMILFVISQYFLSLFSMLKKSLRLANYALRIITINAFCSVGVTLFFAFKVAQDQYNPPPPSDSSNTIQALFYVFFLFSLVITGTHLLFTLVGSVKVRNLLIERTVLQSKLENKED